MKLTYLIPLALGVVVVAGVVYAVIRALEAVHQLAGVIA